MRELRWIAVGAGRVTAWNRPKLKDIPNIAAQGCQRIVTIQGDHELPGQIRHAAQAAGLAWTWVPVGNGSFPRGDVDRLMRLGLRDLVKSVEAGESVLVHCSAGIHRTGMLVFALLRWLQVPEIQALELMAAMRPQTREGMRAEHIAWGNQVAADSWHAP